MHSHVVKCMTHELPDVLDEWAGVEQVSPGLRHPRAAGTITPHYVGGRDWVVTVLHPDHDFDRFALDHGERPAHGHGVGRQDRLARFGDDSREALASVGGGEITGGVFEGVVTGSRVLIGDQALSVGEDGIARMEVAQVGPVRVQTVHAPTVDAAGAVRKSEYAAMVEDEDRTWALWVDADGRPASMWLRRDASGGVIEPGIGFDDGGTIFTVTGTRTPWPDGYETDAEIEPGERVAQQQVESAAAAYHDAVAALAEVRGGPLSTTIGYLLRQGYLMPTTGGRWVEASEVREGDTVALVHGTDPGRMTAATVSEVNRHEVPVTGLAGTSTVVQIGTNLGGFVRYATEPVLRVREG